MPDSFPRSSRSLSRTTDPDNISTVIQTSGTGGSARGVCLTYRNHLASAISSAINLGVRSDDRWLLNLPLYHVGGFAIVMRNALYGTTIVLADRSKDREWDTIFEQQITQLSVVQTTLRRLLDSLRDRKVPQHIRSILVGGGPCSLELLERAKSWGLPVLPTYGMTETASQIATLSPSDMTDRLATAGKPLGMVELEIRNEDNRPLPAGTEGRIHVRGPMLGVGYWRGPSNIESLADAYGWFATSDIGFLDAAGYLTISGRVDNVIISGGEKIHAEEIEELLLSMPEIESAAVIDVLDDEWGRVPIAYVQMKVSNSSRTSESEVLEYLSRRLPRHKLPRGLVVVAKIPLLPTGKVDRQALRSQPAMRSAN